jgi:cellulose synthase/poly-beta-1,6-N-acetylglucosamine synthase-like glycosyltransferase
MLFLVFCYLLLTFAALAVAYYWFLALTAWTMRPAHALPPDGTATHRFVILIPAHNEGRDIRETLRSCKALDYPRDRFEIVVVADNCTDDTADVARAEGVACLERVDRQLRGKGHALAWGFEQIAPRGFDAVLVLDADCVPAPHALRAFDARLRQGELVLQSRYVADNAETSPTSYALAVGNFVENDWFYRPKHHLGLAVFLRGTGMVFHRSILERFPWNAHSIVEDVEYGLTLLRHGIRVAFVDDVTVRSAFPDRPDQLRIQRQRWACGNAKLGKLQAVPLLFDGLRSRNLALCDAGWTLLVQSRPLVLALLAAAFACCTLACFLAPEPAAWFGWLAAGGLVTALTVYLVAAVYQFGLSPRRIGLFLRSPIVALRLAAIAVAALAHAGPRDWLRTPR